MKKIYLLFLLMLLPLVASADPVLINGIYYNLNTEGYIAEVTANPNKYTGKVAIPASVTYNNVAYSVTSIGERAFMSCRDLTSINIPNSVTSIGRDAFAYCNSLVSIAIAADNTVYDSRDNCNAIIETASNTLLTGCKNTTIPNSVTTIGERAFYSCDDLTSIYLPSSIQKIGNDAFSGCELTSIDVDGFNPVYDSRNGCNAIIETATNTLVVGCVNTIIPFSVIAIGDGAFKQRQNITSFTVPGHIKRIGRSAFSNCIYIKTLIISEGVEIIGDDAFGSCWELTTITLPSTLTQIGNYAFSGSVSGRSWSFYINLVNPLPIQEKTFGNRENSILYVPSGSEVLYRAADYWKEFKQIEKSPLIDGLIYKFRDNHAEVIACFGGDVAIPESVRDQGVDYPVTSIGWGAFRNCTLNSLSIGANLSDIQSGAFENSDISWITVSADNTHFDSRDMCSAIIETNTNKLMVGSRNTIIPNSVTSIGESAFCGCKGLKSVTIPNSVTTIGNGAFSGCTSLSSVAIPNSVVSIETMAFQGCSSLKDVILPTGITSIEPGSFADCTSLVSITIPEGVTTLKSESPRASGWGAFSRCSNLENITLPNSLTIIGNRIFEECEKLVDVAIPDGVKSIGNYAFDSCLGLTSVTIPKGVASIGINPFSGCSNLTSIIVESGNQFYNSDNGCNAIIETNTKTLVSGCRNTIIPDDIANIGDDAFNGCRELKTVVLPQSVISIGNGAFRNCPFLTSINIPNGVKEIAGDVLYGCKSLKEIIIPGSVTDIAYSAFSSCDLLKDVYCYADNVPFTADNAFNASNTGNLVLHVPAGSVLLYQNSSPWSAFKEILPLADSDRITLRHKGKVMSESSTDINAEDWAPENKKPENDMTLFLYKGDGLTKTAKLEIQSNTLNAGNLKWNIGGDTYDVEQSMVIEKAFDIDENGETRLSFAIDKIPTEGSLLAKLTINVEDESKTYMINARPYAELAMPLTFEAVGDEVKVVIYNYYCSSMPTIQYSIDGGPWTDFYLENNDCHGTGFANNLPAGKIVQLRGYLGGGIGDKTDDYEIDCLNDCYIYGNIMSVKNGEGFADDFSTLRTEIPYLFHNNTHIRNHPTKDIVLPATTLSNGCYRGMFKGCTGLTRAPKLPATTLTEFCYAGMFMGCTDLIEAPELPATKLEKYCYIKMFEGCSNLKYVKCLANENIIAGDDSNIGRYIIIWGDKDDNGTVTSWLKDAGTNVTGTKTFIVNENLSITGNDPTTATVENWGERSVSGIPEDWTIGNLLNNNTASITIGKSGKASYCGDKSLDFSFSEDVKAYIATGFDETEGTIWLTRVKDVPAGTPVLIKGEAEKTYQVPVTDSENSYYTNMFVGNSSGATIQITETDGDLVNYYLSGDGAFKSVKNYANIGNNKCYLQLPGTFAPSAVGAPQTVTIKSSGKASFAAPVDLDFTNVAGLKAFTATGYDKSSKTIWLTRVMKVQKGEGVLLKGDANDYEIPSVAVQSSYMNMFKGNTSGAQIKVLEKSDDGSQTNFYLKADGTFVSVNGYVNINNNKCYLELPTDMVSGVASTRGAEANFILEEPEVLKLPISFRSLGNDGDGTTGVKEVKSGEVKSEEWFTLQGQRVVNPGKGLYIKNGKKVMIK